MLFANAVTCIFIVGTLRLTWMEEKDFKSFGIRYKIVYLDWHLKKKRNESAKTFG